MPHLVEPLLVLLITEVADIGLTVEYDHSKLTKSELDADNERKEGTFPQT